jgi:hypothetical protein
MSRPRFGDGVTTFKFCGHPMTKENSKPCHNHFECRTCARKAVKEAHQRSRSTPEGRKASNEAGRRTRFGPGSTEHYDRQFKKQKGLCAICRKPVDYTLSQDHDHDCCPNLKNKSGRKQIKACGSCNRGLLCNGCNFVLDYLENPTWLKSAQKYLAKWS